jgi:hypothetical protein
MRIGGAASTDITIVNGSLVCTSLQHLSVSCNVFAAIVHTMPTSYSVIAVVAIAVYAFLQWLLKYTQDPREPPPLATSIPFLSPIIGMSRKKTKYYIMLR